ncbi:MAG: type II toxin-antitoxin system RelE/ParE family toxin [Candidatus Hodarchaeota archaeon]
MAKIKWSLPAINDLESICDYIARDSPSAAEKLATEINERVKGLEKFPRMGRIVPEREDPDLRELILGNYRIIYRITDGDVEILAIMHSKRKFSL